jgi:hypothetical protein
MENKKRVKKLKLFIWEGVLTDYTSGMVAIYAYDLEHALKLARKKFDSYVVEGFAGVEPQIVTKPDAFYVYGGG